MTAVRKLTAIAPTVLALGVGAAGCGGDDVSQPADSGPGDSAAEAQLELGEQVFTDNCATCHGNRGQGGTGPRLGSGAVVERYPDADDHRAVVVNGRGRMPAWGARLTDDEIDAVVRYEREGL